MFLFSGWIDSLFGCETINDQTPVGGLSTSSPSPLFPASSHPVTPTSMACPVTAPKLNLSGQHRKKLPVNIARKLMHRCESALGGLAKQLEDQWKTGPVGTVLLELRVKVYLALASLAKSLLHSRTAYQLSLQALRLIQAAEDCADGESVKVNLESSDLRLWLECRYWVVHSITGILHPPKGVDLLQGGNGEDGVDIVKAVCAECVKLGEVELMAQVHMGVAEHALSSLPTAVPEAMHHSQVSKTLCSYWGAHGAWEDSVILS